MNLATGGGIGESRPEANAVSVLDKLSFGAEMLYENGRIQRRLHCSEEIRQLRSWPTQAEELEDVGRCLLARDCKLRAALELAEEPISRCIDHGIIDERIGQ